MGGAFTAIADDSSAVYYNPAGLAQLQRKEFAMTQATLPSTAKMNFIGLAWPTKKGSTFALGITQFNAGGFEKVKVDFDSVTGEPKNIASGGSFVDQQQSMSFAWAKSVTENFSFGLAPKQVSRTLDGVTDSNLSMDVGLLTTMGPYYRMGFAVQNVFSKTTGKTDDKLPVVVKIGNSFRFFKDRLTLALDANKPLTGGLDARFGGEYWVSRWFAFRFGLKGIPDVRETDFGFGLKFKSFALDIAQGVHDLGPSSQISFTLRFGKSKEDSATQQVETLRRQGFDAFDEGNFVAATQKFNLALDAQPGNQQIQTLLARLMSVTTFVPQAIGGEEFQVSVRKGAKSYVDGRDLRSAVNSLRHAFNQNPKDEKLLGFLNIVEKEAGVAEITRKLDGPEQFTWVDQKIYDARQSIYDGKYDAAVRRSQDVLDLEPSNVTAMEIMGSAFYLMEQKDKALAVWKRVLEIDPTNQAVRDSISRIR